MERSRRDCRLVPAWQMHRFPTSTLPKRDYFGYINLEFIPQHQSRESRATSN